MTEPTPPAPRPDAPAPAPTPSPAAPSPAAPSPAAPSPAAPSPAPPSPAVPPDADAGATPAHRTTVLPAGGDAPAPEDEPKRGSFLRELPVLIAIALILALLIKAFLVQAFYIPSGSMEQTLRIGDRVLVNKLVYRFRDIHRGEIVVFNGNDTSFEDSPETTCTPPSNRIARAFRSFASAIGVAPPCEKDFIKRVIGVAGDRVQCCDPKGRVLVNGVPLDEPYVYEDDHRVFGPVTVPKDRLWVMGDHRSQSADSREHIGAADGGFVPTHKVIGRAFVKVWPLGHIGGLPVPTTFTQKTLNSLGGLGGLGVLGVLGGPDPALALGAAVMVPFGLRRRRRRLCRLCRRRGRAPQR